MVEDSAPRRAPGTVRPATYRRPRPAPRHRRTRAPRHRARAQGAASSSGCRRAAAALRADTTHPSPSSPSGLTPLTDGRARVAVRLERESTVRSSPTWAGRRAGARGPRHRSRAVAVLPPARMSRSSRVRPLRPGLSVAHPTVTAGTLGGFVRTGERLAILSNNHVLAASDAAALGDPCCSPARPTAGRARPHRHPRPRSSASVRGLPNLVDAAVARPRRRHRREPGVLPGGPLSGAGPRRPRHRPGRGRREGRPHHRAHPRSDHRGRGGRRRGAVRRGGHRFDDQIEIQGAPGRFSAGGDSGSVIWRSRDRAPVACSSPAARRRDGGTGVTFANPLVTVLAILDAEWFPG